MLYLNDNVTHINVYKYQDMSDYLYYSSFTYTHTCTHTNIWAQGSEVIIPVNL